MVSLAPNDNSKKIVSHIFFTAKNSGSNTFSFYCIASSSKNSSSCWITLIAF